MGNGNKSLSRLLLYLCLMLIYSPSFSPSFFCLSLPHHPLSPINLLLCFHSKSFNGSGCCIVLIYMTYTMLPLRLRESLIGGMLLSGTHLYSCLTHTTTQYTRQLDTQLAMETETQLQAALPWQEVSNRERERERLLQHAAQCNCLWLPQIKWVGVWQAHLSTGFAAEHVNKSRKCATLCGMLRKGACIRRGRG